MTASNPVPDSFSSPREYRPRLAIKSPPDWLWNLFTLLTLMMTALVVAIFGLIFRDPYINLNPYPPPTLPVALVMPSPTATQPVTPQPTASDTATPTPVFIETLPPTPVQIEATETPALIFGLPGITVSPSPTLRPTATPGGYAFVPQEGSPDAIPFSIYSDVGCNYLGVGGRVIGLDGSPVTPGVIVRLAGTLEGKRISLDTLSGTVTQFGESGFGFQLADHPITSKGTLYVQLLDQAYLPMSGRIYFDTYDECDKNLIFITFRQGR